MKTLKLPKNVGDLTVMDLDKDSVPLDALWEDRRVVLVFLRHFG
jgi:hypothetical protein